jgi:hypothetical protein
VDAYENSSFFFSEFSIVGEAFYSSDYLSYFSKIILIFISVHFLFFFKVYLPVAKVSKFETILLFLISILASFFLLRANDLMAFYLSIELQTLCFYLLIISKKRDFISITSALKYFLLGTAFSAILLFGLSIVYTTLGTTTYEKISLLTFSLNNIEKHQTFFDAFAFSANLHNKYFQFKIGCFLISIAFLFKLNAFPFHLWSPDVYEGTPRILTAFFLIIPKFTVIISFVSSATQLIDLLSNILTFLFSYDLTPSPNCKYVIALFLYDFVHPTKLLPSGCSQPSLEFISPFKAFVFEDELYLAHVFEDDINPILKSDYSFIRDNFYSATNALNGEMNSNEGWEHPDGSNLVGWTKSYKKSAITYLQFGDGVKSYENKNVRMLLRRSINWVAEETKEIITVNFGIIKKKAVKILGVPS